MDQDVEGFYSQIIKNKNIYFLKYQGSVVRVHYRIHVLYLFSSIASLDCLHVLYNIFLVSHVNADCKLPIYDIFIVPGYKVKSISYTLNC